MIPRLFLRWLERAALGAVIGFAALYGGDSAVYKLRGSPTAKVTVDHYLSVPLKGQRTEFDYLGSVETPCAQALFPQAGLSPCWQLRRHASQGTAL